MVLQVFRREQIRGDVRGLSGTGRAHAREAGKIHLTYFRGGDLAIRTKSNVSDVVTRADRESEALIARMIAERFPDHAVLGEEGGTRGNAHGEWLWVVDPLDGTTNYSQGLPVFTVSIALQHRGETVVGVVYAPYLDELYTATLGGGAARAAWRGRSIRSACRRNGCSGRRSSPRDFPTTR